MDVVFEPLASHHLCDSFSCGNDSLDNYLRRQASQDARRFTSKVFVMRAPDSRVVLGYYTLSASAVRRVDLPNDIVRTLPKYPQVPVVLIGRLALDQRLRGKGMDAMLLADALKRSLLTDQIGWVAVVVDAIDDDAVAFYQRYRFIRFSSESRRLFLPRKNIPVVSEEH